MKAKKIFAMFLAATMVSSLVACGSEPAQTDTVSDETASEDAVAEAPVEAEAAATIENPSTDFSDGLFGFIGIDKVCNPSADESVLSMSEFNGKAAVKVEPQGTAPYVAIQMDAMVGDKIADVASVAVTLGIESSDGKFYAASGNIYEVLGGEKGASSAWSIYKESINPKIVTHSFSATPAAGDYVVVSLESDVAFDTIASQSNMYILDITFLDKDGNTIDVDTSAEFVAADTGADRTNLFGINGAIDCEFTGTGAGWAQIYQDLTDDQFAALTTPGSVVEIEYSSSTGNIWMGLNGNAWKRIGVGDCDDSGQGYAYYNNSKSIAQITYEDIASVVGEDTSAWDKQLFIESDGDFEVYSVKIGQQGQNLTMTNGIDIELAGSASGWAQIGYDVVLSDEALEMLKTPGSGVKIEYSSNSGDIWMGLSGNNWKRVGVGNADDSGTVDAITDGSVCYVTYDMIAEVCGEDTSAWDTTIFVESDDEFEVYSVTVGMLSEMPSCRKMMDIGLAGTGAGWAQIGYDVVLSEEALEALKTPGSVVVVSYASTSGDLWIGLSGNNWKRVGVGNADDSGTVDAITDGSVCYVTYDMIAEVCGEDTSAWDTTIFVESDSDFEVFGTAIGQN